MSLKGWQKDTSSRVDFKSDKCILSSRIGLKNRTYYIIMQITDVCPGSKEGEGDPDSLKVLVNSICN